MTFPKKSDFSQFCLHCDYSRSILDVMPWNPINKDKENKPLKKNGGPEAWADFLSCFHDNGDDWFQTPLDKKREYSVGFSLSAVHNIINSVTVLYDCIWSRFLTEKCAFMSLS